MGTSKIIVFQVGVLTHNNADTIGDALESLICQKYKHWSATIYDDGSNDKTAEVISHFLADDRISYVKHQTNIGQARNWAAFLRNSTAPYLAVLHADDMWERDFLCRAAKYINEHRDVDIVYRNWRRCINGNIENAPALKGEQYCRTGEQELSYQLERFTMLPSSVVLSSNLVRRIDPPNPNYKMIVDGEYLIRAVAAARNICFDPTPGVIYRVHGESVTSRYTKNGRFDDERLKLFNDVRQWLLLKPKGEELVEKLGKQMAVGLIGSAKSNARLFRFSYAIRRLSDADRLVNGKLPVMNRVLRALFAMVLPIEYIVNKWK